MSSPALTLRFRKRLRNRPSASGPSDERRLAEVQELMRQHRMSHPPTRHGFRRASHVGSDPHSRHFRSGLLLCAGTGHVPGGDRHQRDCRCAALQPWSVSPSLAIGRHHRWQINLSVPLVLEYEQTLKRVCTSAPHLLPLATTPTRPEGRLHPGTGRRTRPIFCLPSTRDISWEPSASAFE
jgi:hypothetical protein